MRSMYDTLKPFPREQKKILEVPGEGTSVISSFSHTCVCQQKLGVPYSSAMAVTPRTYEALKFSHCPGWC